MCRRSTSRKGRHSAKAQLVLFPRTLDFIAQLICYAWRRLSFFVAVTVDKHGSLCCLLGKACRSIGLTTCLHCFLVVVSLLFQVFSVSRRPFDHAQASSTGALTVDVLGYISAKAKMEAFFRDLLDRTCWFARLVPKCNVRFLQQGSSQSFRV